MTDPLDWLEDGRVYYATGRGYLAKLLRGLRRARDGWRAKCVALRSRLAAAERIAEDLHGQCEWLKERFEDCYNAAGCEGLARHPVELWNWIEARVASEKAAEARAESAERVVACALDAASVYTEPEILRLAEEHRAKFGGG